MESKKYYWLKLKKDFFKRHDIRIVEDMPNGKDYILFYLKMLVESVDHEGELRFSDSIPYNEQMLATITNTNPDIVRAAMQVFTSLNMIEVLDNDTIYMTEVHKMIGSETEWARQKKEWRDQKKLEEDSKKTEEGQSQDNVLPLSDKSKSKRKSKSIEKDMVKKITPPTIEEVFEYCNKRHNGINPQLFLDYYTAKGWSLGGEPIRDWKALVRAWENNQKIDDWDFE